MEVLPVQASLLKTLAFGTLIRRNKVIAIMQRGKFFFFRSYIILDFLHVKLLNQETFTKLLNFDFKGYSAPRIANSL